VNLNVLLPWPDFTGAPNGFTLIASSTQRINQVTLWTCSNNRTVISRVRVYKGELDNLTEVASSTPISPNIFCPSNLSQRPWLITGDEYRLTFPLENSVHIDTGERLTIFVDSSPYNGGYLLVGAHPTRDSSDFITMASTTAASILPPSSTDPSFPSFELVFDDGCIGACVSNVLFFPGFEASRMYRSARTDEPGSETQLWEPSSDTLTRDLFLDANGKQPFPFLSSSPYTRDLIDEAYFENAGPNIYKSFLADLDSWKNTEQLIADYSAIPYDWRFAPQDILAGGIKDGNNISYIGTSANPYIKSELARLVASSKTGKVTIIAHSNGGLVAKMLLKQLADTNDPLLEKVDNLILVASPQVGTPQAMAGLLHGYEQGIPKSLPGPIQKLTNATAREFGENLPGAYALLPSAAYFTTVHDATHPLVSFDDSDFFERERLFYGNLIGNSDEYYNFLLGSEGRAKPHPSILTQANILNPNILAIAMETHIAIDDWAPPTSMKLYQIAGWGEETIAGMKYHAEPGPAGPLKWHTPDLVLDGDGTVVVPSALYVSTSTPNVERWWVNLGDYNSPVLDVHLPGFLSTQHANILEVSELRTLIKNMIIEGNLNSPIEFISTSTPLTADLSKRLTYLLHSPLTLSATDDQGNEISIATSTIPGARYREFGEIKYLSIPASVPHHLVLNGYASGMFTLEVDEREGNTITASTTFLAVPTATTTRVTMDFTDGTIVNASPLSVDEDGDGVTDFSLIPKVGEVLTLPPPAPSDITPPEALITFSTSTNAIIIQGIDDSGTTTLSSTTTYPTLKKNQKQYNGIATTTVTIKDLAGNITQLTYTEKLPSPAKRDIITLVAISYNGATSSIPATLKYKWANKPDGTYKLFATYFAMSTMVVETHFRPKKNITVIMQKPIEDDDGDTDDEVDTRPVKTKLSGFIVPSLVTKNGKINVTY